MLTADFKSLFPSALPLSFKMKKLNYDVPNLKFENSNLKLENLKSILEKSPSKILNLNNALELKLNQ